MLTREELSCNYLASTPAMAPPTPVMNINMRRLCFVLILVMSTTAAFGDHEDAACFRCGHHHDGRHARRRWLTLPSSSGANGSSIAAVRLLRVVPAGAHRGPRASTRWR
jgi:hypothetical protein